MFDDVGSKIKTASKVIFFFQIVCFIIIGSIMISIDDDLTFAGICVMLAGIFIGWFSSILVYGFGELVDRTKRIDETLNPSNSASSQSINRTFGDEIVGTGKCEICGKDDRLLKEIKFNDGTSITNKKVCQNCILKMESKQI